MNCQLFLLINISPCHSLSSCNPGVFPDSGSIQTLEEHFFPFVDTDTEFTHSLYFTVVRKTLFRLWESSSGSLPFVLPILTQRSEEDERFDRPAHQI
jgi:hypothetical protein